MTTNSEEITLVAGAPFDMTEVWMLVRRGVVQRYAGARFPCRTVNGITIIEQDTTCWPVAKSHDDALRLAKWTGREGVRPAKIGSVPGETLEGHVRLALQEGISLMVIVSGWTKAGAPIWDLVSIEVAA